MFPKMSFFTDCFTVIRGVSRLVAGAPRLVTSTPRWSQACCRCSQVISSFSQSHPWYSHTSYQRSQLLTWPAGMPSYGLTLSWNWHIYVYTAHLLRHSWRLQVTKLHFADVHWVVSDIPLFAAHTARGNCYIHISKNPSIRLKYLGVPDGSDGCAGTLYPLTEN